MPYYPRYRYRRPYRRYNRRPRYRRPYRKTTNYSSAINTAAKALSVARGVAAMLNVEKKYHNVEEATLNPVKGTGQVSTLSAVGQGDGDTTRDGNQLKWVDMTVRGEIVQSSSAINTQVRLMLVVKKDTNGTAAVPGDILQHQRPNSFFNRDEIHNYWVVQDRTYQLNSASRTSVTFKMSIRKHIKQRFGGSGNTVAAIEKNGMFLVAFSDESINVPAILFDSRGTFVDN